jgi:hypothetical protein
MAVPGLTYRVIGGSPLTHTEMNNNFRSLFYSSSIQGAGSVLNLHFDTVDGSGTHEIPLNAGSGGVSIQGNANNRVITGTDTAGLIQGETNFTFDGSSCILDVNGTFDIIDSCSNLRIGTLAGNLTSCCNTIVGCEAAKALTGNANAVFGRYGLVAAVASTENTAIGDSALGILTSGNQNTSIGACSGVLISSGTGNVTIGFKAGPASSAAKSNKLYINNSNSDTPLILGDFSTGHVTINSTVSASFFSGSHVGDGSGLTGVTATAEWDGSRNGDANITGSFVVSGSLGTVVDFTNVAAISGSIFSGSFFGDGSNLTGVQADTFPYTGSAIISGSLYVEDSTTLSGSALVQGPLNVCGMATIDQCIQISNRGHFTALAIGQDSLKNQVASTQGNIAIGYRAGCGITNHKHNIAIGINTLQNNSRCNLIIGHNAGRYLTSMGNVSLGFNTLGNGSTTQPNTALYSTLVGYKAGSQILNAIQNTGLGTMALQNLVLGGGNAAVGYRALNFNGASNLNGTQSSNNTAIGAYAGETVSEARCSVFIGYKAGPLSPGSTAMCKLYIGNAPGEKPLIFGDFHTKHLTINNIVSASILSGSHVGDGSALTGVEWDGTRNGNANITGSFTVSGSLGTIVNLTDVDVVSGSLFSGSFIGNGAGLTGVTSEWDGSRNGNSNITGSLIVSGALDVSNTITLASTNYPGGRGVELINFNSSSLAGNITVLSFAINATTGYTGLKADYVLTDAAENQKKVGTLLGGWDRSGNSTINDSHTEAPGAISATAFSIDASSTNNAILKLNAAAGSYDLNMIITAFKRQV